jgi:hypothetical protein
MYTPPEAPLTVLALDLGTRTGWALHRPGRPDTHGLWVLPEPALSWKGKRWAALRDRLVEAKNAAGGIDLLYYEYSEFIMTAPNAKGVPKAQVLSVMDRGALYAVVQSFALHHEIPAVPVNPSTIKKAATGNGRAKKLQVIAAVNARHGLALTDKHDNHADAIALLDLALAEIAHQKMLARAS